MRNRILTAVAAGLALLGAAVMAPTAQAQVAPDLNFQGRLTDAQSNPITTGTTVVFRLYTSATGGTAIWSETQTVTPNGNGVFSVRLGSVTTFASASVTFNQTLFLGLTVGADAEMTPRFQLNSAPSAVRAEWIGGVDASTLTTSVTAASLNTLTAGSSSNADALHTHALSTLTGTLSNAQMAPDAARLSGTNAFTGANSFSNAPAFNNAGAPFTVTSNQLVGNLNADQLDGIDSTAFGQLAQNETVSGTWTFSSQATFSAAPQFTATGAPFTVGAGSSKVANLDADLLDGIDSTGFAQLGSAQTVTGNWTFSGNNTFSGTNTFSATSTVDLAGIWQISGTTVGASAQNLNDLVSGNPTNLHTHFGFQWSGNDSTNEGLEVLNAGSTASLFGDNSSTTVATTAHGLRGRTSNQGSFGVLGENTDTSATTGNPAGIRGTAAHTTRGIGVHGLSASAFGVRGEATATNGVGVDALGTGGALALEATGPSQFNGNVDITGANLLQIGGTAAANQLGFSGGALASGGNFTVGGNLSVTGTSSFSGGSTFAGNIGAVDVNASNDVNAANDVTAGNNVVATGNVSGVNGTFTGNVAGVNGNFSGNVSGVQGNFSGAVSGTTGTFSSNVSGVDGTFSGNLAVTGTSTLGSAATFNSTATFNGNTTVTGANTFSVGTGATTLGGTLGVSGAATFGNTVTHNGNVSVTGANTLQVGTGATTLGGTLGVIGNAVFGGTATFNGNTTVAGTNTFDVGTGATTLGGTLSVAGLSTFNNNVDVTGTNAVRIGGTAAANTLSFSGGALQAGADLNVGNDLGVTNDLTVGNNLSVTGSSTFSGTLGFQNGTAFTMSLSGTPTANRTLTFPDATGTVVLEAQAQTLTNKTIDGNNNTLTVLTSQLSGTVADGQLSTNVALLNGTQSFSGTHTFGGAIDITGTWAVNGTGVTATAADLNNILRDDQTGAWGSAAAGATLTLGDSTGGADTIRVAGGNTLDFGAGGIFNASNASVTLPNTGITGAGAGSGLDADTVDGIQGSQIPQLNQNSVVTGNWQFNNSGVTTFTAAGGVNFLGAVQLNSVGLTSTASELNRLSGVNASVTSGNLNTLTGGAGNNADSLHEHSLSAAALTGTLPDGKLSANVALLNAANSFSNANTFSAGANFTGGWSINGTAVNATAAEIDILNGVGGTVTTANLDELTDGSSTNLHNHFGQSWSQGSNTAAGLFVENTNTSGATGAHGIHAVTRDPSANGLRVQNTDVTGGGNPTALFAQASHANGISVHGQTVSGTAVLGRSSATGGVGVYADDNGVGGALALVIDGTWAIGGAAPVNQVGASVTATALNTITGGPTVSADAFHTHTSGTGHSHNQYVETGTSDVWEHATASATLTLGDAGGGADTILIDTGNTLDIDGAIVDFSAGTTTTHNGTVNTVSTATTAFANTPSFTNGASFATGGALTIAGAVGTTFNNTPVLTNGATYQTGGSVQFNSGVTALFNTGSALTVGITPTLNNGALFQTAGTLDVDVAADFSSTVGFSGTSAVQFDSTPTLTAGASFTTGNTLNIGAGVTLSTNATAITTFANTPTFNNGASFATGGTLQVASGVVTTFNNRPAFAIATGQPFTVASSVRVDGLNAQFLNGRPEADFAARADAEIVTGNWDFQNTPTFSGNPTFSANPTFSGQPSFTGAAPAAPFQVSSNVVVTNLNADQVDGLDDVDILRLAVSGQQWAVSAAAGTLTLGDANDDVAIGRQLSVGGDLAVTGNTSSASGNLTLTNGSLTLTNGNLSVGGTASLNSLSLSTALPVGSGGTGLTSFGASTVVVDDGAGGLATLTALDIARGGTNSSTALNNNRIMVSNGGAIVEAAALTNGQILVGSTGAAPVGATLTGTANQVSVTNGAGSITLSTPQDIDSTASPTFAGGTFNGSVSVAGGTSDLSVGRDLSVTGNTTSTNGNLTLTNGNLSVGGTASLASLSLTTALPVGSGGTGLTSFGASTVLVDNGTGGIGTLTALDIARGGTNSSTALSNNRIMVSNGGAIVEAAALGDGQLLIGSAGNAPVGATLSGTANQVSVTNGAGSITLSTPQDIDSTATPTFAGGTFNGSVSVAGAASDLSVGRDLSVTGNTTSTGGSTTLTNGNLTLTNGNLSVGGTASLASLSLTTALPVGSGGTGLTSFGASTVLVDNGTGGIATLTALDIARGGTNSSTALNNNRIMVSSSGAIVEAAALGDGQLLIGSTGNAPVGATLTGTTNQVTVTNASGSITLSTPQDIDSTATPIFAGATFNGSVSVAGATSDLSVGRNLSVTGNTTSTGGSITLTNGDLTLTNGNLSVGGTSSLNSLSLTTALSITNGGTGATSAPAAATNLGLGTGNSPSFAGATLTGTLTVNASATLGNGADTINLGTATDQVFLNGHGTALGASTGVYTLGAGSNNTVPSAVTSAFGTANSTLADVGAAYSQTTLNDNFQDLVTQIENLRTLLNTLTTDLQNQGIVR